jgi:hypothetical protein
VDVVVTNPDDQTGTLLRGFTFTSDTASLGLPEMVGGQGQVIEVPINAANLQGLTSATLTVGFDPAVLSIQDASLGNLTPGWSLAVNTNTSGQVTLSMASGGGSVTGAGVLSRLAFAVTGAPGASSDLMLSGVSFNDGAIAVDTANGSLTVADVYSLSGTVGFWNESRPLAGADLLLSGMRLYSGSTDTSGAYSISGVPAGDYSLTASHDSADNGITAYDASLALRHDAGLQALTGNPLQAADVNQNGAVTAQDAYYMLQRAVGLIDLPFQGAGKVWLFEPTERTYAGLAADQTGQDFTAILLGDPSGNWSGGVEPQGAFAAADSEVTSTVIALPHITIPAGEQFEMPVSLHPTVDSIQAVDLELHYDPAVVSAVTVDRGDLGADWQLASNLQTAGVIRVSLAGSTPLTTDGALALLRITLQGVGAGDATGPIQLVRTDLDEGTVSADHVDGAAMVADTFTGDHLSLGGMIEDVEDYVAQSTITLGPTMTIASGASVSLQAGERIAFQPGFRAKAGATLTAKIGPGF